MSCGLRSLYCFARRFLLFFSFGSVFFGVEGLVLFVFSGVVGSRVFNFVYSVWVAWIYYSEGFFGIVSWEASVVILLYSFVGIFSSWGFRVRGFVYFFISREGLVFLFVNFLRRSFWISFYGV